ncbi:MAG: 4Fe-4S dicluster domain-containing protein [Hydrogenophaga sp.]|uniref:4Fe-4S double cluster binding domain-containing protein n=1 Tax=Hydrogenophaga sp. TaxID=1904254 RepID=UPI00261E5CC6|nr:4Fe-4S double cluster binding domain-containing protein [Hydrogenophaga sp.]MCV0438791.1 4Fe-4S dicluster domain-containing protein [Hydrogenophaga sp.]
MRLFSYRDRPVHLGPYPLERLTRQDAMPELKALAPMQALSFDDADPESLKHAMARFITMFDLVRDGAVNPLRGEVPAGGAERAEHIKAAGYYFDASMMAICTLPREALLAEPIRNPRVPALGAELEASQPRSFAAGMDMILADVLDSARKVHGPVDGHTHAIVILVEYPRDPRADEPGCDWIQGTQAQRAAVLTAQTAVLLSTYLRMLGYEGRAHSATCSDVDLGRLALASGLTLPDGSNPYMGRRFGLAAVTTDFAMTVDRPLSERQRRVRSHGPAWWLGKGTLKNAFNREAFARREFRQGAYPFETLKRQDDPTTFIDHARVPRFPKRADFFARALFGDLGKPVQDGAKNAHYVMKSPIGACARRALGALLLLQFGEARGPVAASTTDPRRNADNLKATAYYLGVDAVGLCGVPEWAYYSHDAGGNAMQAYHANAVNLLLDQGHETMEGASGDDWISVAQSMRAYLRFSMLGGIIGEQIRRLGYSARVHSVLDGDVLQPPLLLLSGLGEVSRIGEVILNPFLGPRLKSGTVTTDLPMAHDRPIDFGLQRFCESCNKCARECPSGAITAGPKLMYNGYEIWKSDAEKCARYRITNAAGGMCGRCMKTCPWNLEGLLADGLWRQVAMKLPVAAPALAALDDKLGRGAINPVKTWWWDVELDRTTGGYVRAAQTNRRGLQTDLALRYEDQTLAVYPADRMPPPYPVPFPVNRDEGIERYRALLTPQQYKERVAAGDTEGLAPPFRLPEGEPPVFPVLLKRREEMALDVAKYEFAALDGGELPAFEAGAHVDVVIAPEYQRAYSLAGDPADRSRYVLGVLREAQGRGGSALMHRAFREGRKVFISRPANHFPLHEDARHSLLFAGGIGVTPMIAMAHRLHALGRSFDFHYSAASRKTAGFLADLEQVPWREHVSLHIKDEGSRADLAALIPGFEPGFHLYTCGAPRYMDGVFEAATRRLWPEDALHREYFSVPDADAWENHPFVLELTRSGRTLDVPADRRATDVLAEAGFAVTTKCSDGLCGVCAVSFDAERSGTVEHRDFVLSRREREHRVILCCSRPAQPGASLVVDL